MSEMNLTFVSDFEGWVPVKIRAHMYDITSILSATMPPAMALPKKTGIRFFQRSTDHETAPPGAQAATRRSQLELFAIGPDQLS